MFVERKTRIDLRNRGSETGRDLPGAHRVLGSYGTLGDKVCVCVGVTWREKGQKEGVM